MTYCTRRRAAIAVAGLGTAALTMVLTAPTAAAGITGITIDPGISSASSAAYGSGCSYTVTATSDNGLPVFFGSTALAGFSQNWVTPVNGRVSTVWTPRQTGTHVLTASSGEGGALTFRNTTVVVGNGVSVGPGCVVLP
jgi:hypothetical protein